jgi:pimeloyl-ACP methyl ester carboxylesterase
MKLTHEHSEDGVTERHFELEVAGETVPGILWTPAAPAAAPRPLLLAGHGGSQHKQFPPLVAAAKRYAKQLQIAVLALDAPGHGARANPETKARLGETFRKQLASGQGLGGETLAIMSAWATQAQPEWSAAIDAVQAFEAVGAGAPVAYLGLSLGAMIGIPLVAAEPRIKAAIVGLAGAYQETPAFTDAARRLTAPVLFVAQWDDELVRRDAALALFDAIGSAEKTLHANRGGHGGVPPFERAGWDAFLARHLQPA